MKELFCDKIVTMKTKGVIIKAKKHFLDKFEKGKETTYPYLSRHVETVEKWANKLLRGYPEANKEIVLLAVWLHDIGQTFGNVDEDHAKKSEIEARLFLTSVGYPKDKIDAVAHCVRAHRRKDVKPKTIEAKVLVASDSASHFTDINYIVHLTDDSKGHDRDYAISKIERDYRDLDILPNLKEELTPLYRAWKELFKVFPEDLNS